MSITGVESAWAAVWADSRITAFTSKVIKYEYTDDSEAEIEDLSEDQAINFIEAVTERQVTGRLVGGGSTAVEQAYTVDVRYTRERDTDGDTYRSIVLFFETLSTVVDEILDSSWTSTVDFYTEQTEPIQIQNTEVAGAKCWRATYRFQGRKLGPI